MVCTVKGQGTTFTLNLTIQPKIKIGGEKYMDKHPRILVVDDDETIRTTMKAILQDEGYIVDLAGNWQRSNPENSRQNLQRCTLRH